MDSIIDTTMLIAKIGIFISIGMLVILIGYLIFQYLNLIRISRLIDAEFEKFNDFMPSKWDDDWNSYDEIDEPLTPIKKRNEWLLSSNHRDGMEVENDA